MVCTRDGRYAYIGGDDGDIRMWDIEEGKQVARFIDSKICIHELILSSEDKLLASAGDDNLVRVWNAQTAELISVCKGHGGAVNEVQFAVGGRWLTTASGDGTVRIWNSQTGQELRKYTHEIDHHNSTNQIRDKDGNLMRDKPYYLSALALSQDGKYVVGGGGGTRVSVWDIEADKLSGFFQGHSVKSFVASAEDGKSTREYKSYLSGVKYLPGSDLILSVGADKTVRLWSSRTLQESWRFTIPFEPHRFALSEDGRRAIFCGSGGALHVWALPAVNR